jgi:predicted secreted Zn-dependent protease
MVRLQRVACVLLGLAFCGSALPVVGVEAVTPGSPTTPRTSSDAPRFDSDVPQFAGPATLRLHGTAGSYRWAKVFFGAQEVVLRMTLVPVKGSASCATRVRLGTGTHPLHRQAFTTESSPTGSHRTVVDVDYETVPLVVRSDCRRWSLVLVPRDDPTLPLKVTERHYTVRGGTTRELAAALEHIDGRWAAQARTRARWTFRWVDRGSRCDVIDGQVSVRARLELPWWQRPTGVTDSVVSEWERVRESLCVHELGHVTIALQGAHAVDERLDAGFTARTCDAVERAADRKATEIWERHQRRHHRYDRLTQHGRTQGTWFE